MAAAKANDPMPHKCHASIIKRTIHSHIGWAITH